MNLIYVQHIESTYLHWEAWILHIGRLAFKLRFRKIPLAERLQRGYVLETDDMEQA